MPFPTRLRLTPSPASVQPEVLRGGPTRRLAEAVTIDRMRKEIRRSGVRWRREVGGAG